MAKSYDAPADELGDTEASAPATTTFTGSKGATSRSGPGNWGVAARWFMFAILAIAFFACLYLVF